MRSLGLTPSRILHAGILLALTLTTGNAFGASSASVSSAPQGTNDLALVQAGKAASIIYDSADAKVVGIAAGLFAADIQRVTGVLPVVTNSLSGASGQIVLIGTIGHSTNLDALIASGKINVKEIQGGWERNQVQVVENPFPGVTRALVVAGSDRRGAAYGVFGLSEVIGVSPWYWWADVPPRTMREIYVNAATCTSDAPAVRYRGIFINDEDWGLRPWATNTFEPENGNIGPETYTKIFELLLRLRANYLWPAMHPGTTPFNSFPTNREIADAYAIVMGSSHCEQMLRNNVGEWDEKVYGDYNFVTNPSGVLKYWEERVRENGKFENVYTVGMRGIHDGAMPGGGTEREKAARLQTIITDQRDMLARLVNTNVAQVPQIFCPYKEVLGLYRLSPNIPEDITLVWPDDNYGYIRQFSDAHERARSGGAGVYYHVSYYGRPNDYLWLCTMPPALIAEEMTKAYDYGANQVWLLNVGDLKPAELDIEFFLKLAWNPHAWNGANTYDLFQNQLARDFGAKSAPELTSILAEYYRLNFQRKPEHLPQANVFSAGEAPQRLEAWHKLSARVDAIEKDLPSATHDAFFELIGYPVRAAAAMNEKCLAGSQVAAAEIHQLTARYNNQTAGGKWRGMMSDNPRKQIDFGVPKVSLLESNSVSVGIKSSEPAASGADFVEAGHRVVIEAEHASKFISGKDANWQKIVGLGYNGETVGIFPATVAVRTEPGRISAESPCLQYKISIQTPGDWQIVVRALPTFSVETGKPQRYAIAVDDEPLQIMSLPVSSDERNRVWQENVLRNSAITTSHHAISAAGLHTLKIWMVDPGIVLDAVAAEQGNDQKLGYLWPEETRRN